MNDEFEDDWSLELFRLLRELIAACGQKTNKNDLANVLIEACIAEGLDTRRRIVGALKRLGLDYRHVVIILGRGTGEDPERDRWQVDGEGHYRLHEGQ